MVEGHPLLDQNDFERRYLLLGGGTWEDPTPCDGGCAVDVASASAKGDSPASGDAPASGDEPCMPFGMFKAKDIETGDFVVLRHPYVEVGEGIPGDVVRELTILRQLENPCVLRLVHSHLVTYESQCACTQPQPRLWLVYDNFSMELRSHLKRHGPLEGADLSRAVLHCLQGLSYCHEEGVVLRDLRPDNVFLDSKTGRLKLGGFSSAISSRQIKEKATVPLGQDVSALWCRAPELLLGQREQGPWCDIWSLGCIVAEMATAEPLFQGSNEVEILMAMFDVRGVPAKVQGLEVEELHAYMQGAQGMLNGTMMTDTTPGAAMRGAVVGEDPASSNPTLIWNKLEAVLGRGSTGTDFLAKMLCFETKDRESARKLLKHSFFYEIRRGPELWAVSLLASPGPSTRNLSVAWANRGGRGCSLTRSLHRIFIACLGDADLSI